MERQNRNLLLLFVALCLISAGISYRGFVSRKGIDPHLFRIPEDVRIDRFSLKRGDDSVVVSGAAGGWTVNGKYTADLNRVRLFFAAMDRARPRRWASGPMKDSLSSVLRAKGFSAQFSEQGNQIFSVWAIGDEEKGVTWFARSEKEVPAEMTIPGYRSNPISVFSVDENDWRDKRVFSFNWRNFTDLKAEFPDAPNQNFAITVERGLLSIPGLEAPDTVRLKNYIDAIQLLEAEAVLGTLQNSDSLLRRKPDVLLTLSEVSGRTHQLRLFGDGTALIDSVDAVRFGTSGQRVLRTSRRLFDAAGSRGARGTR